MHDSLAETVAGPEKGANDAQANRVLSELRQHARIGPVAGHDDA
jgi:hypothetical protein